MGSGTVKLVTGTARISVATGKKGKNPALLKLVHTGWFII